MGKLIIEGLFVNHDKEFYGQVEIDKATGLIEYIGSKLCTTYLNAGSCIIFPGFGDIHVHARQDVSGKNVHKEDFRTASEAAINGGITFFADMPNNPIAPTDDHRYAAKAALATSSLVPVVLYAGIGPGTKPLTKNVPYKLYMGAVSKGGPNPYVAELDFHSREAVEEAIKGYKGQHVSFHCEDSEVLLKSSTAAAHESRRPKDAELLATDFALQLIKKYSLKGKICHFSVGSGLESILDAKKGEADVTCEVTPHHLYFDSSMLNEGNRLWLQMNPPLRTEEDRLALIEALRRGDIDYLATDHAPHTIEEKMRGISGVPHLDTYGGFVTWLMRDHSFSPQDIARVCSYNPGIFVNPFLPASYGKGFGRVEEGYAGSLTVIDPASPLKVSRDSLKTKCKWSPFEGMEFPGRVKYTIVLGEVHKI